MSVAAEMAEMHPQTLRKYERAGLLAPARADGYHRLYSDEDIERLAAIRHLAQAQGVNVAGIRLLMRVMDALAEIERMLDVPAPSHGRLRNEVRRLRAIFQPAEFNR